MCGIGAAAVHGAAVVNRLRWGAFGTLVMGSAWATAGLWQDTDTNFLVGVIVAMLGLIAFTLLEELS